MKKGAAPITLLLLVAVLIVGIVIFSPKLKSGGTSLSQVTGGTTVCSDPDGSNYKIKGTCTDATGKFTDYCSGLSLREYFCCSNKCQVTYMTSCPLGYKCCDGACIRYSTYYTLSVSKNYGGVVTSKPAGISCGTTCSYTYSFCTTVNLTATPYTGYNFIGWTGACTGKAVCTVLMASSKSVTATFSSKIPV